MATTKCSFCGNAIPQGQGLMFVRNDGRILYFCGSKCERNTEMGREGKRKKWTKFFEKDRGSAKSKESQQKAAKPADKAREEAKEKKEKGK